MEIIHWIEHLALLALLIIFTLDGLTFLWVRRVYQIAYRYVIKTRPHCILMLDIDGFKSINDRYGHKVGDRVLRRIGITVLKESRLRGFRYGGEEFSVLLPWTGREKAFLLAERIRRKIESAQIAGLKTTVSIGIGTYEEDADEALYRAKNNGKNRTELSMGSG